MTLLVQTTDEAAKLEVTDPARVSYLTQTTLAVDETAEVVDALRTRFPALRGPTSDDICYATTNRQDALKAIAAESDLVLVAGSGTPPTPCAWWNSRTVTAHPATLSTTPATSVRSGWTGLG